MLPTDLIITDSTHRGIRVLKDFLGYAFSGGKMHDAGKILKREPDSDFEISVAKILSNYGYKVAYQVGVAGFFIDLGVLHPDRENDFIMGVECDGATYHSGKSVRDRDRLRQEILEKKGWHIHRIWSTDWFKNREKEIDKLIKTLKKAESSEKVKVLPIIKAEEVNLKTAQIQKKPTDQETYTDEDLRKELLHFRKANIEPYFSDQSRGILRDELLEYFIKYKPTTKEEFRDNIPLRLRESIDWNQLQFLDDIFQIIEEILHY